MYDWNHNGKHDAFDDAMFMALYEDDLERHPPGRKKTYRPSSDDTDGCFWASIMFMLGAVAIIFVGGMLILGFLMAVMDGDAWLLLLMIGVIVGAFCLYIKFTSKPSESSATSSVKTNNTADHITKHQSGVASNNQKIISNSVNATTHHAAPRAHRVGAYNVVRRKDGMTVECFLGVDDTVLELPAKLNSVPVRIIGNAAFLCCNKVEQLIIPEGIWEIRSNAFNGCDNLREVVLASSIKVIEVDAFPSGQDITFICPKGSYGIEYAKRYNYKCREL